MIIFQNEWRTEGGKREEKKTDLKIEKTVGFSRNTAPVEKKVEDGWSRNPGRVEKTGENKD